MTQWARGTVHSEELKNDELASYIATGKLPEEALAQRDGLASAKPAKPTDEKLVEEFKTILGKMAEYEKKIKSVHSKADVAYTALAQQHERLSANYAPIRSAMEGLIKTAASVAAKAEVQTMLDRLTRMHYNEVGALDRSATYWLNLVEKEKEAERVALARDALRVDALKATKKNFLKKEEALNNKADSDKAKVDQWREDMWAELKAQAMAGKLKGGLQKPAKSASAAPCELEAKAENEKVAALPEAQMELVPSAPNQVIVSASATID